MYNTAYFAIRLPPDSRRAMVWEELARFFAPWLPPHTERVVEIGAGYCDWINVIKARERYAVDVAETVGVHAASGVTPVVCGAANLLFAADASVDVVLASNIIEHLTPEEGIQTFQEIFRVLRQGGRLFIVQPNFRFAWREYFDDYTHRTIFTDCGLRGQLEAVGLRIIRCWPRLIPFSFKSVSLPTPRLLVRAYLHSPWRPGAKQMAIIAEK